MIHTNSTATGGSHSDTYSVGIYGRHGNSGNLDIDLRGGRVETDGTYSHGVLGYHLFEGDLKIDTYRDFLVQTRGPGGHGIWAYHSGTADTDRQIKITVGGPVLVDGAAAQGVRVGAVSSDGPAGMADLDTDDYRRQTVTVNGPITSAAEGVFLANGGRVIIGPQGSIDSKSGIAILATGTVPEDSANMIPAIPPKLRVDLNLGGRQILEALGDGWILNDGGETTIAMNNVVLHDGATGVTGRTAPNGAWDVQMVAEGVKVTDRSNADPAMWTVGTRAAGVIADRDFSATDFTEAEVRCPAGQTGFPNCRALPPPSESTAMQVDTPVVADANEMAGVVVEGDGTVQIGAQGSVRAASGIAILATADESGDEPELTVDMNLGGRQVGQVIGDDWIINDGGGTTIEINGVKLHDATTGVVPGAVAPNGAFDVRTEAPGVQVRPDGVRVLDRSDPDPANWEFSDREVGIIADRDFSAADFVAAQVGADPESPPMMIEDYAPRSAVYEVLPDVLLGLQAQTPGVPRSRAPAWFTVSGYTGSQDFDRSTVGTDYDIDYFQAEAGKYFTLKNGTEAWASLQYLKGTADVDSPVQGGDIDVQGLGLSLELCRGCKEDETYVLGQLSLSRYDLDLDSDTKGRLKSGVNATAYTLAVEAGKRLQKETLQLIPRVRLEHTRVSIDRFTDTMSMPTRVSYPNADRLTVALGIQAETSFQATQDGLSWYGSLDLEHRLDDAKTTARVMGERCEAEAGESSVLLGAGAAWQRNTLKINAGLTAREGLDTGAESYGARLDLALQF